MQNATIKYKIRLLKPTEHRIGMDNNNEIELELSLEELEGWDVISDRLMQAGYYDSMGFPSDYWTVIERTIETFEDP